MIGKYAQSLYGSTKRVIRQSEKAPQYSDMALAGAAAFGAYGAGKGVVSDDSTVVGGAVGGGAFGAGVGALGAMALNRSPVARDMARRLNVGVMKTARGFDKRRGSDAGVQPFSFGKGDPGRDPSSYSSALSEALTR